jgi:glycine betaine transporter
LLWVTGLLVLAAWLALGRHGRVRLGRSDEVREFSTPSWLSMLFAALRETGLVLGALIYLAWAGWLLARRQRPPL